MTTKICTKCNVEKDIEEFSIRSGTAETRISRCKLCEKERTSEYSKKLRSTPYGAYLQQKSNASSREIEFKLSFEKWLEIWTDSGKFELRGRGIGFYCMCRIGDKGAYEEGNVFIDLCTTNTYAGNIGKIMSIDTRAKISNGNRGKEHSWSKGELNPMHRAEAKAKLSAATSGEKHYRQRGINTPTGYFATSKLASEALNIKKPTVEWRARNNKFGYSYSKPPYEQRNQE